MPSSLRKYLTATVGMTAAVVWHAFDTREQFYPAVVYLTTSKVCVAVLANCALAAVLLLGWLVQRTFLGSLREAEVERAFEKAKEALMETCLAMTIFREEFNAPFVVGFVCLLLTKVWHWLVTDRADYLQSAPVPSLWVHARVLGFMACLFLLDCWQLQGSAGHVLSQGPSVQLLFAFEHALLASTVASALVKYALHGVDGLNPGGWEGKGTALFYLELVTDLFHLLVYLAFFLIVFAYYGLPLHLVRELYWTFRQFRTRLGEFVRFRRVTVHLNDRFPDATPQQLADRDATCIICREDMVHPAAAHPGGPLGGGAPIPGLRASSRAKRLTCGHCFHMACLRSWLERQQTCPTCRAPVAQEVPAVGQQQPGGAAQQQQQQAGEAAGQPGDVAQGQAAVPGEGRQAEGGDAPRRGGATGGRPSCCPADATTAWRPPDAAGASATAAAAAAAGATADGCAADAAPRWPRRVGPAAAAGRAG